MSAFARLQVGWLRILCSPLCGYAVYSRAALLTLLHLSTVTAPPRDTEANVLLTPHLPSFSYELHIPEQ
jgi:hypothetical protein